MKKLIIFSAVLFALSSCSKETPYPDDTVYYYPSCGCYGPYDPYYDPYGYPYGDPYGDDWSESNKPKPVQGHGSTVAH